jgi:hypothetical protein
MRFVIIVLAAAGCGLGQTKLPRIHEAKPGLLIGERGWGGVGAFGTAAGLWMAVS